MTGDAVVADGIHKSYGEVEALKGVSLSVDEGEVFCLIGPNGAGKTTLVRCLTGTASPTEGEARLLGSRPSEAQSSLVGVLPQEFTPPERLTALELVEYYAGLYDEHRDAREVLDDVGVGGAADTRYTDLSGGQKRRVCVATSLVNSPEVVFLDEPTTGIDPAGRESIWELVEELAGGGTTVFLTTHYMEEAETLGDRVGLLSDGVLVEVGEPSALVRQHGGGERLVVETQSSDLPELGFDARVGDGEIVVEGVSAREIGGVLEKLDAAGVEYDELTWKQPGLDEVYMRLAGGDDG